MGENMSDVQPSSVDFLAKVDQLISPSFSECFSHETRKVRDQLLMVSVIPITVALGIATLQDSKGDLPVRFLHGSLLPFVLLCIYFLAEFAARSFPEWKLWRLHHQAPMLELVNLSNELGRESTKRFDEISDQVNAARRRLEQLLVEPENIADLRRQFKASEKTYQEYAERRDVWYRATDAERKALEREIRTLYDDSYLEMVNARIEYLYGAIKPGPTVLRLRLWLDVLFPSVFGIMGISLGIWQLIAQRA
jgi:cell division protein FtsB